MTVREYIENRPTNLYGKKIRILDAGTHKNCGGWVTCSNRIVKDVKITTKYIFIYV